MTTRVVALNVLMPPAVVSFGEDPERHVIEDTYFDLEDLTNIDVLFDGCACPVPWPATTKCIVWETP